MERVGIDPKLVNLRHNLRACWLRGSCNVVYNIKAFFLCHAYILNGDQNQNADHGKGWN